MIDKLLEKLIEAEFEDTFKPLDADEVEKRKQKFHVSFDIISTADEDIEDFISNVIEAAFTEDSTGVMPINWEKNKIADMEVKRLSTPEIKSKTKTKPQPKKGALPSWETLWPSDEELEELKKSYKNQSDERIEEYINYFIQRLEWNDFEDLYSNWMGGDKPKWRYRWNPEHGGSYILIRMLKKKGMLRKFFEDEILNGLKKGRRVGSRSVKWKTKK